MTSLEPKKRKNQRKKLYSAPALEKGLDIIELLTGEEDGLSTSEIGLALGRTVGEIFRMLVVLEQRGYVVAHGLDRFSLSLKMFNLSHKFPPVKRLTIAASRVMQGLARDTVQSCHLVIYYEGRGQVVVQQDAPSERMFSVRLGAEAPLVNTCSGHILLAYADAEEREQMLRKVPSHHGVMSTAALDKMLERVRALGYETIKSNQSLGVIDIAYAVFDHNEQCVAALVVPYLTQLDGVDLPDADVVTERLALAAGAISSELGYHQ